MILRPLLERLHRRIVERLRLKSVAEILGEVDRRRRRIFRHACEKRRQFEHQLLGNGESDGQVGELRFDGHVESPSLPTSGLYGAYVAFSAAMAEARTIRSPEVSEGAPIFRAVLDRLTPRTGGVDVSSS